MAHCPSMNQIHGNGKNLYRTDYAKQIPMRLFEDSEDEQSTSFVEAKSGTLRGEVWNTFPQSTYNSDDLFVVTPPMTKKILTVPNAPKKTRKPFTKIELKPKKLDYIDKYKDISSKIDSGICVELNVQQTGSSDNNLTDTYNLKEKSKTETLNTVFKNMYLDTNNNENKKNSIEEECYKRKLRSGRVVGNKCLNTTKSSNCSKSKNSSTKDFKKYTSVLSQCDNNLNWQEKLLWLQDRRDVGMMILCCRKNCQKWRYTDDYHDPVDVPEKWYCEMNSDKTIASCLLPEIFISNAIQEDLIENKYNAGSIVWGHLPGYPWWPAIVDDCPTTFTFYELRAPSIIPVKYHVTFFGGEIIQHTWLNCKNIKAFIKNKKSIIIKKTKFCGIEYAAELNKAYILAKKAIPLSIQERLQNFSFISRLTVERGIISISQSFSSNTDSSDICDKSPSKSTLNDTTIEELEDSLDEIIPGTPQHLNTSKNFNFYKKT